jgi:hypothetical protein
VCWGFAIKPTQEAADQSGWRKGPAGARVSKVDSPSFLPEERRNRQEFRCQFFSGLFCFIVVSGVSQRWEFKNTTKMFYKKNRVEKHLQKKRQARATPWIMASNLHRAQDALSSRTGGKDRRTACKELFFP